MQMYRVWMRTSKREILSTSSGGTVDHFRILWRKKSTSISAPSVSALQYAGRHGTYDRGWLALKVTDANMVLHMGTAAMKWTFRQHIPNIFCYHLAPPT